MKNVLPIEINQEIRLMDQSQIRNHFKQWLTYLSAQAFMSEGLLVLCDSSGFQVDHHLFFQDASLQSIVDDSQFQSEGTWNALTLGNNAISQTTESFQSVVLDPDTHHQGKLQNLRSLAVPVQFRGNDSLVILGWFVHPSDKKEQQLALLKSLAISFHQYVIHEQTNKANTELRDKHNQIALEAKRKDILFQCTKKLYSTIDVDSVLSEVISNIRLLYPSMTLDLFLSTDYQSTIIPVKPMVFNNDETDPMTRAFMEGQTVVDANKAQGGNTFFMATPLCGKQGVYGVLTLNSATLKLEMPDIQFISMLADTAGIAFENAKLYEASNVLINELRIINEINHRLNQSLKLSDILNLASTELTKTFGADYSCIVQLEQDPERATLLSSNLTSFMEEQFISQQEVFNQMTVTKEPVFVTDVNKYRLQNSLEVRYMVATNSRSLISSPIRVNGEVQGIIFISDKRQDYFTYEKFKLLQVLASHISLAMTNASLHAEVRRMVITDNLTKLFARHYLDEQMGIMLKRDACGTLIMVDVDHFKKVNDTYGHQIGDEILKQVSNIIKTSIREGDIAARWGGEEMAIYLPGVLVEQALRIAERIRVRVMEETEPKVTISSGISVWQRNSTEKLTVEAIFYKADMALYQAKHGGRNQVKIG